jgi:hypothetical protein
MTSDEENGVRRTSGAAARADRLAAALKENLKKRKDQARSRRRVECPIESHQPISRDKTES